MENLSDKQAAEAVRARIDWKYALGLELEDPGFDASVLTNFRARLLDNGSEISNSQSEKVRGNQGGERSNSRPSIMKSKRCSQLLKTV